MVLLRTNRGPRVLRPSRSFGTATMVSGKRPLGKRSSVLVPWSTYGDGTITLQALQEGYKGLGAGLAPQIIP